MAELIKGEHDLDIAMDWCRRCGRPYEEIVNLDLAQCDGLPGVIHSRYTDAKAFADKTFGPMVDKILKGPPEES